MKIPPALRQRLAAVKDGIEERLHPGRRDRARRRLRTTEVRSVLFVCLGNVCRSPYAERVFRAVTSDGMQVSSAGFIGPGRCPPDDALAVARKRGVDHADHVSQVLTRDALEGADAVFFFDSANRKSILASPGVRPARLFWLGDFDPGWGGKRAIIDPWGRPIEDFERVFERIERCLDEVHTLTTERSPSEGA